VLIQLHNFVLETNPYSFVIILKALAFVIKCIITFRSCGNIRIEKERGISYPKI